jgi:hypothetical protein
MVGALRSGRGLEKGECPPADVACVGELRRLGPPAYRRLCATAERVGALVRIERDTKWWILGVVLQGDEPRGGALAFPGAAELDKHADYLHSWLVGVTGEIDDRDTLL